MIINSVYIMSCLPKNNPDSKKIRMEGLKEQLIWIYKNNFNEIIYNSMNWTDEDKKEINSFLENEKIENLSIKYIDTEPLHFSDSRNLLLSEFYNSNNDWGLFLDDDGLIDHRTAAFYKKEDDEEEKDKNKDKKKKNEDITKKEIKLWVDEENFIFWLRKLDYEKFIELFNINSDILKQNESLENILSIKSNIFSKQKKEVGLIVPLNPGTPGLGAFKEKWSLNKKEFKDNWMFIKTTYSKGTVMFIKNFKKHNNIIINFRPFYELPAGEDFGFSYDVMLRGFGSYICENFLLKEISQKAQSTWIKEFSNTSDKVKISKEDKKILKEKENKKRNAYKYYLYNTFKNFGIKLRIVNDNILEANDSFESNDKIIKKEKIILSNSEFFKYLKNISIADNTSKWHVDIDIPKTLKVKKIY